MAALGDLLNQETVNALSKRSSDGKAVRPAQAARSQDRRRAVHREGGATKASKLRRTRGRRRSPTGQGSDSVSLPTRKAPQGKKGNRTQQARRQLQVLRTEILELKRVATLRGGAAAAPGSAKARRQMDLLCQSLQDLADASPRSTQLRSLLVDAGKLNRELKAIERLPPGEKLVHPLTRLRAASGARKPPRPLPSSTPGPAHTNYYQDPTNSK